MLDKEQYELITKPGVGLVAIQGSAGSGKTTVGLHRVAYLHASSPTRYRAAKMLVIVPNEALIHYTSRVLPGPRRRGRARHDVRALVGARACTTSSRASRARSATRRRRSSRA